MVSTPDPNPAVAIQVPRELYDPKQGRVRVWMLAEQEYRYVHSMDAREYVHTGVASFYKPGEEPTRGPAPAPPAVPTMPPVRETPAAPEAPTEAAATNPMPTYPFAAHNVAELQVFAEDAGIDNYQELRKDRLVAALIASGYKPQIP